MSSETLTRPFLEGSSVSSKLRTLGDELLGAPFELHARGPERFDCWGLCWYCLEQLGRETPDLYRDTELPVRVMISRTRDVFDRVRIRADQALPGDVLFVTNRPGLRAFHCAIVESAEWALESAESFGVCRSPLSDFNDAEVYRWRS